jgi:hypothetical protein
MDYEVPTSPMYRAIMTGLFVGIIDTLLCLVFNLVYRESTGFSPTSIINVSSLIFFVNLLFPLIGVIYNWISELFKKGDIVFTVFIILLTVFFVWRSEMSSRTDDHVLNVEFRTLLAGLVIIMGISAAVFIPLLYHNKKFNEHVV